MDVESGPAVPQSGAVHAVPADMGGLAVAAPCRRDVVRVGARSRGAAVGGCPNRDVRGGLVPLCAPYA